MCKLHYKAIGDHRTSIEKIRMTSINLGKEFMIRVRTHEPRFERSEIFNYTAIEDNCEVIFEYQNASDIFDVLQHLDDIKIYAVSDEAVDTNLLLKYFTVKGAVAKEISNIGSVSYTVNYFLNNEDVMRNATVVYGKGFPVVPYPTPIEKVGPATSDPEPTVNVTPTVEEVRKIFAAAKSNAENAEEQPETETKEEAVKKISSEDCPHNKMGIKPFARRDKDGNLVCSKCGMIFKFGKHPTKLDESLAKRMDNSDCPDDFHPYTELIPGNDFNRLVKDLVMRANFDGDPAIVIRCSGLNSYVNRIKIVGNKPNLPGIKVSTDKLDSKECWCFYDKEKKELQLYSIAEIIKANEDMNSFLRGFINLTDAEAVRYIDFGQTKNISGMLMSTGITNIDFMRNGSFHGIISMNGTFKNCKELESVSGMENFDWSSVEHFKELCFGCKKLKNAKGKFWREGAKQDQSSKKSRKASAKK